MNVTSNNSTTKEAQLNSVKDLIIFNDHQYTKKNTNLPIVQTSSSSVPNVSSSIVSSNNHLPPLSIEEVLNDNQSFSEDYSQELSQDYNQSSLSPYQIERPSPFYSSVESSSLESSEHYLNDNYLDFNFDHNAISSFQF